MPSRPASAAISLPGAPARLALIAALAALGPLSVSMILPALPAIAAAFAAEPGDANLTLTLYLAGFATGQLVYGPLSDQFGRRRPLLAGLILYLVACGACLLADGIGTVIAARLVQGLGGAAGAVIARALVRDSFDGPALGRAFAIIAAVLGVAPALGPTAGGLLTVTSSWRGVFAGFALLGAGLLVAVLAAVREPPRPAALGTASAAVGAALRGYVPLLRDKPYRVIVLCCGFASAALFLWLAGAPHLFIEGLGFSPDQYGYLGLITSAGYIGATVALARLRAPPPPLTAALLGCLAITASMAVLALLGLAGVRHWLALLAPAVVCSMGVGLTLPSATTAALTRHRESAGTASALLGFAQMAGGVVATPLLAHVDLTGPVPMALLMAAAGAIAVALAWHARRIAGAR